ncbi:GDSL Lipase Acylhydrolase family protein [Rutstroemia sp. NJR-2017a WRK4]|nr:GDSL Lipase Acylhydrolase family protein [Rutstroemia sp. NJR-2017a WRK4]PQE11771.1 GDSL Lipase Acylhydrolase family protein [Rutstroemia sp. NJR-2017a WRK4]
MICQAKKHAGRMKDSSSLHFTGDGYKILFEEVTKCIKDNYPEQVPEKLDAKVKMQWEKDLGW